VLIKFGPFDLNLSFGIGYILINYYQFTEKSLFTKSMQRKRMV